MSVIYTGVVLRWAGKEYKTKGSYGLNHTIEQTISLAPLGVRLSKGDVPLTFLAEVYSHYLKSVDVNVSAEEVNDAMYGNNDSCELEQEEVINLSSLCLQACFATNAPEEKTTKKKTKRR